MSHRFVSYAQNFEDVMLWRALKDYPPGAYVDVGANDPVSDSVTKAFYDRGWRGINIDAVPSFVERLSKERPEDSNLNCFVGAVEGSTDFYQVADSGLSTYRKDYADKYKRANHEVSKFQVVTKTLTSILEESGIANECFHFLKVDVEGAELDVLSGLDLKRFRPWIVVIEATEPNSTNPSLAYEPKLLSQQYSFHYFDGLSRFYVAEERSDLIQAFQSPPCVFDNFELFGTVQAREATLDAQARGAAELDVFRELVTSKDKLITSKDKLIESKDKLIESKDQLIEFKDKLIESKNTRIHSSHLAMIQFERSAFRIHSTFTKESERAGKGLSDAYKNLYSSFLWRRGAWIARLFRSKAPRASLNKAAKVIKDSNSRHGQALKKLHADMSRMIMASPAPPAARSRLGKSAAAITDLINAGYTTNPLKQ